MCASRMEDRDIAWRAEDVSLQGSYVVFAVPLITWSRFEKSLYDLIRGLRNHKGNEKEYIQNSLKECRAEIRGQDMGRSILQNVPDSVADRPQM